MSKIATVVAVATFLVGGAALCAWGWPELFSVWLQPLAWLVAGVLLWRERKDLRWSLAALALLGWVGAADGGTRVGSHLLKRRFLSCSSTLAEVISRAEEQVDRTLHPEIECFPVSSVRSVKSAPGRVAVIFRPDYPSREIWIHSGFRLGARFGNRCLEKVGDDWYRGYACPGEEP